MLIPVQKDGQVIEVHPSTLAAHEAAGWVQCERVEFAPPEPQEQAEAPKRRGRPPKAQE